MENSFQDFFREAYADVFFKKAAVVVLGTVFIWGLSRLRYIRDFLSRPLSFPKGAFILFGLALALRLLWIAAVPTEIQVDRSQADESSLMHYYALSIQETGLPLEQDGTLQTRRPAGYPYLIAGLYKIVGPNFAALKLLQALLSSLLIFPAYFLGRCLFKSPGAAFLFAVYPANVFSTAVPLDEFPFFLFTFTALVFAVKNLNERQIRHTGIIALLLGLATLFRTHTLLFPPIFFIVYMIFRLPIRAALVQMLLSFVMIFALASPWAVVTARHYGAPCFFTTYGSVAFYGTLNDKATWDNGYIPLTVEEGGDPAFIQEKNPVKAAGIAKKLAREWVLDNPAKVLKLALQRNAVLYGFQMEDGVLPLIETHSNEEGFFKRHLPAFYKISNWAYVFILFYGVAGCLLSLSQIKKYPGLVLLLGLLFYWSLIHGLLFGFRKYRWFADLLLLFPAAYFLNFLIQFKNPFAAFRKDENHV